jgi:hypothetical protein
MNAKSVSSGSKSASSVLSSGSASAASAASVASASLASGSAKASSYAGKVASDTNAKSASFFAISPITLSAIAVALGAAYYYGYLDGLIAYIQQLMSQAQDQKEQIMKDNTGQTSIRSAAKGMFPSSYLIYRQAIKPLIHREALLTIIFRFLDQYDSATVKSEKMVNQLHAEAQKMTGAGQPRANGLETDGPVSLLSDQAH